MSYFNDPYDRASRASSHAEYFTPGSRYPEHRRRPASRNVPRRTYAYDVRGSEFFNRPNVTRASGSCQSPEYVRRPWHGVEPRAEPQQDDWYQRSPRRGYHEKTRYSPHFQQDGDVDHFDEELRRNDTDRRSPGYSQNYDQPTQRPYVWRNTTEHTNRADHVEPGERHRPQWFDYDEYDDWSPRRPTDARTRVHWAEETNETAESRANNADKWKRIRQYERVLVRACQSAFACWNNLAGDGSYDVRCWYCYWSDTWCENEYHRCYTCARVLREIHTRGDQLKLDWMRDSDVPGRGVGFGNGTRQWR